MNGRSNNSTSEEQNFSLPEFLRENSGLFTTMGVFAAISIYLTRFSRNPGELANPLLRTGVVSSLLIFLLVVYSISKELLGYITTLYVDASSFDMDFRQIELVLFLIPFSLLTFTVLGIVISEFKEVILISSLIVFILGWVAMNKAVRLKINISEDKEIMDYLNDRPLAAFLLLLDEYESTQMLILYLSGIILTSGLLLLQYSSLYLNIGISTDINYLINEYFSRPFLSTLVVFISGFIYSLLVFMISFIYIYAMEKRHGILQDLSQDRFRIKLRFQEITMLPMIGFVLIYILSQEFNLVGAIVGVLFLISILLIFPPSRLKSLLYGSVFLIYLYSYLGGTIIMVIIVGYLLVSIIFLFLDNWGSG